MPGACQELIVPRTVCYIRFSTATIVESRDLDCFSARGEQLIADFDADGHIVGIELIGSGKPCQIG
jgi:hypothetical protein